MTDPGPALSTSLAALWERFRGTMESRVDAVERAAHALASGVLDPETRREAEREAHKLAGAVGTFGFTQGSVLAREAEALLEGEAPLDDQQAARLRQLVADLRAELARPIGGAGPQELRPEPDGRDTLLIVDADRGLAGIVAREAAARGLRARLAASVREAEAAIAEQAPSIILLDLALEGGDGMELLTALTARTPPIPAVVFTERNSFLDRVEVARHGGRGFLAKPSPPEVVLDAVQRALESAAELQSTVLAVDDDPAVLESIGELLGRRGVRLCPLSDPHRFWDALDAENPDVVVLDVDMPGVNGLELCRVLRNDPRWRSIPVLFLTAQAGAETISRVFAAGADDYIPKPIVGPELVNRIVNRLERVQLLRHLADTDPLTGVANRRRSVEQMEQLLRLAVRQEKAFALGVIDLDHFKRVNDGWGHAVGDEVLKRVAKQLVRHFRAEDVVARWGGEEFVVGLFGIEKDDAIGRLKRFQDRLRTERFGPADNAFAVTVSAGVADFPLDADTVDGLYHAADAALYQAKEAGRNRVLPAGWTPDTPERAERVDVLVVEDDPGTARMLVHALETRGYRSRLVPRAAEAMELISGQNPSVAARVVLLDIDAEGTDGYDILRRLGAERVLDRTRVIVLTAGAQEAEAVLALDAGAFDHVTKPFSVPVLLHRIRRALH